MKNEATASVETFRTNVRAILAARNLTPYAVSKASSHEPSWLSNALSADRHPTKIGSDLVDTVAAALGVRASELLDPDFEPEYDFESIKAEMKAAAEAGDSDER